MNMSLQSVSQHLGTGKVKKITKEEALLSKDIEVSIFENLKYCKICFIYELNVFKNLKYGKIYFIYDKKNCYNDFIFRV